MKTVDQLLTQAEQIRIETVEHHNDSERVGAALKDTIGFMKDHYLYSNNPITLSLIYQPPVANFAALATNYPNPLRDWAAMVEEEGVVYCYNGTAWASTGLKAFPVDVAVKYDLVTKATKSVGKNLLNPNTSTQGVFFWGDGSLGDNQYKNITDFIPVIGNVISSQDVPAGMANCVYDVYKNFIRSFNTPQYLYEDGDAFVRFTYDNRSLTQIELGNTRTGKVYYTEFATIEEKIKNVDIVAKSKAKKILGKNLLNPDTSTQGMFFWEGGSTGESGDRSITDFISVTGNVISSQNVSPGMANIVYDENFAYLRSFTTEQYIFQAGDAFVRFTYDHRISTQIESGTLRTGIVKYTEFAEIEEKLKLIDNQFRDYAKKIVGQNKVDITKSISNRFIWAWGDINDTDAPSERSITDFIPVVNNLISNQNVLASTGNNVYDSNFNYLRTFTTPQYVYQDGDAYVIYSYDNRVQLMINEGNESLPYEPYTEFGSLQNQINQLSEQVEAIIITILEVSPEFNSSTPGWGVTKFASMITAHNSILDNSKNNQYKIKLIKPGTYNEWQTVFPGVDGDSTIDKSYQGIVVKDYVSFESGDIDHPENYILTWDGHSGYSNGYVMSTDQAMRKCIFHITGAHTSIKGFKFVNKNTRYCVHPESASTGANNEWTLENCIFEWNGRPNCIEAGGTSVGIGISSGEIGNIKNCKFTGLVQGGIGGHNNGWYDGQGTKPFIVPGAILNIENCDFGGTVIFMKSYVIDANLYDVLNLKNCRRISAAAFGFENDQTVQNWRATVQACEIDSDLLLK